MQIRTISVLGLLLIAALLIGFESPAAENPPAEGERLPEIRLPVPQEPEEVQYLGLKGKTHFMIPQIEAKIVILEIFSMYCPFCQKEAPAVNDLYRVIANRPDLKDKVKIIGIGAGNSPFEVETFRKHYGIPFPLFADADYVVHKALGQVGTPYFIGVRLNPDGSHQVIYSKVGSFGDSQRFLDLISSKAGARKGE